MISPPRIEFGRIKKGSLRRSQKMRSQENLDPSMSGTCYPDGSYTLGFVPRKKISAKDLQYQRECDTWDCNWSEQYQPNEGIVRKYHWVKNRESPRFIDTPYLGKARSKRGSKGLTSYGKRYVRQTCYVMESKCGVKNIGFYTLTVPTCSVDEAMEIAYHWVSIYKYFFKLLRNYRYEAGFEEFYYVGVTENQSARSKRDACPYWHTHFVMPCYYPGTKEFWVSADTLRSLWRRAITNFVPDYSPVSWGASVDAQVVTKSCSGYLSKYFSKGSDLGEIHPIFLPSSWYFSSVEMKSAYKKACRRLTSCNCEVIISVHEDKNYVSLWGYVTTFDTKYNKEVVRGYYGRLTKAGQRFVFDGVL